MTFTNTLQPIEITSALGIGVILLVALGYVLMHAGRLARDLGLGAVRAVLAVLALGGALLLGYTGWRVLGSGGSAAVTLRVESAGLLYRAASAPEVLVSWSEVRALTRVHADGKDAWTLYAGQRELTWDGSVSDSVRLQNLVLARAGLERRERKGEGENYTSTWTRP